MFDFIRSQRRIMMLVLLVLVVPAFAFFGIEGYTGFMTRDKELAQVNGVPITEPEFNAARRAQLEQMRSVLGANFDAQAIDTPAFRERVLNEIIDQRVIATAAIAGRYTVSDEALRDAIANIPAVQENGIFSPQRYRQILASQGMTPAGFEMGLRRDLIMGQVLGPVGATAQPPQAVLTQIVNGLTEQRTVSIRRFDASAYTADVTISDADIEKWYGENVTRLRQPESVDVQYIVLDEAAASTGITVPETEIESFYQQNQGRYGQPERRRVSHILLEVPPSADAEVKAAAQAQALSLSEQIKADPSRFEALAQERSQDPGSATQGGDLGWIVKDTLVPEVEAAVFELPKDQISGAVESPFGFHVLKVTDIQAPSVKPLAEVREEVVAEIKQQMAAARFADLATELTSAVYDQREALAPIAQQLGLSLQTAQGLSRQGLLSDEFFKRDEPLTPGTEEILNQPRVLQIAFSPDVLTDRFNSGPIEISPGLIVALRVQNVRPSYEPSLEQLSSLIGQALTEERALALARESGQAALLIARETTAPEGFGPAEVVSRRDTRNLSPAEVGAVMRLAADKVPSVIGVDTPMGFSLLNVQAITAGESLAPEQVEQIRQQLAQAWGLAEEQSALQVLRLQYDTQILPDAQSLLAADPIQ
jgi:peptidyl-prolyl cis-trans isomerase D